MITRTEPESPDRRQRALYRRIRAQHDRVAPEAVSAAMDWLDTDYSWRAIQERRRAPFRGLGLDDGDDGVQAMDDPENEPYGRLNAAVIDLLQREDPWSESAPVRRAWAERVLLVARLATDPDFTWEGRSFRDAGLPRMWSWLLLGERGDLKQFDELVETALEELADCQPAESGAENLPPAAAVEELPALPRGMVSASELADHYGVSADLVRKRLERWRRSNLGHDGWIENPDRKPRDPKYLFRAEVVEPVLRDLSGDASDKRPAK